MSNRKITDVFYQSGEPEFGIPSHWCVQYKEPESSFVDYEYFATQTEAMNYARANGYDA